MGEKLLAIRRHNAGTLRFGADGMLYVSTGDDGEPCLSQDLSSPLAISGVSRRVDTALGMGGAVTFVISIAALICWTSSRMARICAFIFSASPE